MIQIAKTQTLPDIINRRRTNALVKQGYGELFVRVIVLVLAVWLLLTQVFLITQASGSGMFPALKDGDLIIGFRLQKDFVKNDVVVCTVDGKRCIGRVAARGGDVVTLDDSGTLLVNGTPQSGEIIYPSYAKEGQEYPLRVPEGALFILGDYRTQTEDSRDFGPIPLENVEAKVITILRRRGL